MFWVPLIMGAAALSGAIMSANGKKYIDPAWIEEHTGSHAFAQEFNKMFNQLQSSPQGQEMINSAMSQGQQVANTIKQNATNAGFGGAEGVQSGGSLFATSVADSAPNSLRRMATAAIGQQAQGSVNDILNRRLNAYLAERQQPSKQEVIGNMLMQGGMMGLQASLMGGGTSAKPVAPDNSSAVMTPQQQAAVLAEGAKADATSAGNIQIRGGGVAQGKFIPQINSDGLTPATPVNPIEVYSGQTTDPKILSGQKPWVPTSFSLSQPPVGPPTTSPAQPSMAAPHTTDTRIVSGQKPWLPFGVRRKQSPWGGRLAAPGATTSGYTRKIYGPSLDE